MPERIVIFGGAGFIGSSIAIELKTRWPKATVVAADNLKRRGSELNLPRLQQARVDFVHTDIRVAADLASPSLHADTYIDCSAEPSVLAGADNPLYVTETNLHATSHLLELARKHGGRFLFLSTSRVYSIDALRTLPLVEESTRLVLDQRAAVAGLSPRGITETFSTAAPRSLYGTSKLASELLINEYQASFGVGAIINRCGVVAGPWQMGKVDQGVFTLWVAAHHFGRPLRYIGYGGKQVRDVLDISDLTRLIIVELENFAALNGRTLNVGGGPERSLSLLETTELCRSITGRSIEIEHVAEVRTGDVPFYVTDQSLIERAMAWQPEKSVRQTLESIHSWMIEHEERLKPVFG